MIRCRCRQRISKARMRRYQNCGKSNCRESETEHVTFSSWQCRKRLCADERRVPRIPGGIAEAFHTVDVAVIARWGLLWWLASSAVLCCRGDRRGAGAQAELEVRAGMLAKLDRCGPKARPVSAWMREPGGSESGAITGSSWDIDGAVDQQLNLTPPRRTLTLKAPCKF
jgi:hypothetical protein